MIDMKTNITPFIFLPFEMQEYVRKYWNDPAVLVTRLERSGVWSDRVNQHFAREPSDGEVYRVQSKPVVGEVSVLICQGYRVVIPTIDGVPVVQNYYDNDDKHSVRVERND